MRFSPVPNVSKSKINKAGKILKASDSAEREIVWATDIAGQWRACHAYPINTFQATLRRKIKKYSGETIVAQRLKRMPTIVDKLKRHPSMQLTTMQDIGGVRAVLETIEDVYHLAADYKENKRFVHELIKEDDYIRKPRSEDGYRSVHLMYRYKNSLHPDYDGLRPELQIRTRLQHIWATAIETMGAFLGQALKSRQGDQDWLDFFAITSSAFAYIERHPPIPRFGKLDAEQTSLEVAKAETKLRALEQMNALKPNQSFWIILLAFALYALLHSVLASLRLKPWAEGVFGAAWVGRYYRFLFNALGVITLLPIFWLMALLPNRQLYTIATLWRWLMIAGQLFGLWVLVESVRQTGALGFLGLRQLASKEPAAAPDFTDTGMY